MLINYANYAGDLNIVEFQNIESALIVNLLLYLYLITSLDCVLLEN